MIINLSKMIFYRVISQATLRKLVIMDKLRLDAKQQTLGHNKEEECNKELPINAPDGNY